MTVNVTQAFQELKHNLEISDLQSSTVATRQQVVREVLDAGLNVLDTFLTGSYARHTMIAPLSDADIDIAVVLHADYFHHYNLGKNGGQAGLLDLVKRTLQRTYTRTPGISRNGQAVTVRFSDFVVDVVPSFFRNGGGYLIPNSISSSWISTDPKLHVQILAAQNKTHGGNLVPLIKMIKGWNKLHDGYFRSFHLEALSMAALTNVTISDFPSAVRFCFDKFVELVAKQVPDPAGFGGNVGDYISPAQIEEARRRFVNAFELSVRAESAAKQGNTREAFTHWSKLFGGYFPAYG